LDYSIIAIICGTMVSRFSFNLHDFDSTMIKKFLALPASVKLAIVTLAIFVSVLFAWQPIPAGMLLLTLAAVASVIRIVHYFATGE
jgi:hypothetical protein